MNQSIWNNKLGAWLHDPAEKAIVLMHDPAGHEGGTIKELIKSLNLNFDKDCIKNSDHWASAADRPQWPRNKEDHRFTTWSRVDFAKEPELIHPLTGNGFDLINLQNLDYKKIKEVSKNHFNDLLKLGQKDPKLQFLALWRFGPYIKDKELAKLWQLLPADTRIPDHSIWNHLDLVSAFASSQNKKPALLAMSFGPVQSFISQARSSSDLWAGSHLLSSMVWEGMKSIAEETGPDSFLFPQIRGLAIVDAWLMNLARQNNCEEIWREKFKEIDADWLKSSSDSNPLFAACLTNRFMALVPANMASDLAQKATQAVREATIKWAERAGQLLTGEQKGYWQEQIKMQLENFPHAYWSAIEWPSDLNSESIEELTKAYELFSSDDSKDNFFKQNNWKTLKNDVEIEGAKLYRPNPGILYPPVYELAEKSLASIKATRKFTQLKQKGFRCTLCSEREWLTRNSAYLNYSPGQRKKQQETIWHKKSGKDGIKEGEHLCAICTLKRYWPQIFVEQVKQTTGNSGIERYNVSTHTMALATSLKNLNKINLNSIEETEFKLNCLKQRSAVLPKKLYEELKSDSEKLELARKIPAFYDALKELKTDDSKNLQLQDFNKNIKFYLGSEPEAYYALILMDGDNMGAWLSGTEEKFTIPFKSTWHSKICSYVEKKAINNQNLKNFIEEKRKSSPARHASISQALNSFSSLIVPHIVENEFYGKLIYSGGDDVLAMVAVSDVLETIKTLRLAYSGIGKGKANPNGKMLIKNGFIKVKNHLLKTMGEKATASVGVVIVHHQTPLSYALKELREAEKSAKNAGRNAFCIKILKRGGGAETLTDRWWHGELNEDIKSNGFKNTGFGLIQRLIKETGKESFSRKTFYAVNDWLHHLPQNQAEQKEMASALLQHQFRQHGAEPQLAKDLIEEVFNPLRSKNFMPLETLKDYLFVSEFLGREIRSGNSKKGGGEK
jgi:CRISPR-associated protein Cmr2